MMLKSANNRNTQYNDILKKLDFTQDNIKLNSSGRLIICLIEFRELIEMKYVIQAIFSTYDPNEIGLAIVYGNNNKAFVEKEFSHFENITLIKYNYDNLTRGLYSALLKTPEFYEHFIDWSHILIYQTDALLLRKIDDIYFEYDYIGAPWVLSNHWCKYNAGNGGFSLRNIKSCIRICGKNRNKNIMTQIDRSNEDGFFCSQDDFKYPPIDSELHKAFSVERVNHPFPIGTHQIYHNFSMNQTQWTNFLVYMEDCLINKKKPIIDTDKLRLITINNSKLIIDTDKIVSSNNENALQLLNNDKTIEEEGYTKIYEKLNNKMCIGEFTIELTHKAKNKWNINSLNNYEILLCKTYNPDTVVKIHQVHDYIESIIHKKESGLWYKETDDNIYVIFYPGFPNGGECWADINANGHYNHCRDLPKNGAIILKSKKNEPAKISRVNKSILNINNNGKNILAFDLFTGVGFYNQLFSLECAIYIAHITKRYLVLNIMHPLVACGNPNKDYGTILEYVSNKFQKYLAGFEIREYKNYLQPSEYELQLSNKLSGCIFVDTICDETKIKEFANGRHVIPKSQLERLFDNSKEIIYISKSNASRVFYNFLTTDVNYLTMNKICYDLSFYNDMLSSITNNIKQQVPLGYIGLHLRLGDWHKELNKNDGDKIIANLRNWLEINNSQKKKIYVMMDKNFSKLQQELNQYTLVNTESLITDEIKTELKKKYKNTTIAEFLIQKQILECADIFIGTQGSTVSVHIQYINYLHNKEHDLCTFSSCVSYNKNTLRHNETQHKKEYTWNKQQYLGGHPISWSLFFPDNIIKLDKLTDIKNSSVPYLQNNVTTPINIQLEILHEEGESIKTGVIKEEVLKIVDEESEEYISDSTPFISIDFWKENATVFIDRDNMEKEIESVLDEEYKPIIGIKTDIILSYVEYLANIKTNFILVTVSNDDHCPPYLSYPSTQSKDIDNQIYKLLENDNLIKWLAKNPCIIHYKIEPYILGPKWQWNTTQFNGENKNTHMRIFKKHCLTPQKNLYDKELKKNLLYFNFTPHTTGKPLYSPHTNIRNNIKNNLSKHFEWINKQPFEEYIETLKTYKFCLAPPGRGIDTHRCWEALMVGTIPIVESNTLNNLYINLPVVVVTDWTSITEEYLKITYQQIIKEKNYDFDKLYTCYWKNKIFNMRL
jgi:hypothetical protein